jgi:hypothetical protein
LVPWCWRQPTSLRQADPVCSAKIRTLTPQQMAEVDDFVEFLAAKSRKNAALDRLLAIASAESRQRAAVE